MSEDGVALSARGDIVLIVYQRAARLHRTRWLFDRTDEVVARNPDGIAVLMVVLPTADPPDAPTRRENTERLRRIGARMRRLVTTPVGDAFRASIVRTVMRALAVVSGKSNVNFVTNTVEAGLTCLLQSATAKSPARSQLVEDLRALHDALGVPLPG